MSHRHHTSESTLIELGEAVGGEVRELTTLCEPFDRYWLHTHDTGRVCLLCSCVASPYLSSGTRHRLQVNMHIDPRWPCSC